MICVSPRAVNNVSGRRARGLFCGAIVPLASAPARSRARAALVAFVRARAHLGTRHLPRSRAQRRERRVRRLRERPGAPPPSSSRTGCPSSTPRGAPPRTAPRGRERARERDPASSRIHRRRNAHASGACIRRSGRRARGRRRARGGNWGARGGEWERSQHRTHGEATTSTTLCSLEKRRATATTRTFALRFARAPLSSSPPPALPLSRRAFTPPSSLALACAAVSCGSVSIPSNRTASGPSPIRPHPPRPPARRRPRRSPATTRRFPPVPG